MKTPVWLLMLLLVGLIFFLFFLNLVLGFFFFFFFFNSVFGFCIYTVSCCMGYLPVGRS